MPPQKKREKEVKEAAVVTSNLNGNATINHNNNVTTQANNNHPSAGHNGTATDNAVAASTNAATATGTVANAAGAATMASTAAEQIKLNGHQQEQELFLQAFESKFKGYLFFEIFVTFVVVILQNPRKSIVFFAIAMAPVPSSYSAPLAT